MKNLKILWSMVCVAGVSMQAVSAPIDDAVTQLQTDSSLISQWTSDQFRNVIPFNATMGNTVPSQISMPGFEAGIGAFVSGTKFDTGALNNLATGVVDTGEIDTFSRFPFPLILLHAKAGLPFGIDAGFRLGGVPKTTFDKDSSRVSMKNSVYGIDLRKAIIEEGAVKPFGLTLGLSYTHANGSIQTETPYDEVPGTTVSGNNITLTNAKGTGNIDWKTDSIGLHALVSKKFLIVTPSVGASIHHHNGGASTSIRTTGTVNDTTAATSQSFDVTGSGAGDAREWESRLTAGLEFSFLPFTRLGLNLEYAGSKNIAAGIGFRAQFP